MTKDKKCKFAGSFTCPITGFNIQINPRVLLGMVLMTIWFMCFDKYWHGTVLADLYTQTANLWRMQDAMLTNWMMWGTVLLGSTFAYIFMKGHEEGKGIREGLRFGIIMTLLMSAGSMTMYAVMPIPFELMQMWITGMAIEFIVGGMLLSLITNKCCKK